MFANATVVQIATSFDITGHRHPPREVYGTEGTLIVAHPNNFGDQVELRRRGGAFEAVPASLPYGDGNYRSLGVADMAFGPRSDRQQRAGGALGLHVFEVMEAFGKASDSGGTVEINARVRRPAPLADSLDAGTLVE